ncbi:MAG: hypothetical protein GY861_15955 [bacterium]|nr:hypothetical protein [bacterium]
MSFTLTNLTIVTNNIKAGEVPSLWNFYNEDNDAVTATDYFTCERLSVGDIIDVFNGASTAPIRYRVSAKSSDTFSATVTELAAQDLNAQAIELQTFVAQIAVEASTDTLLTQVVTSAANTTSTFTAGTVAAQNSYITLTKAAVDGTYVILTTTTTLPAGLAAATAYYMVNSTSNKCQLSLTHGGAAVTITDAGTGTHTATAQSNQVMLADGVEGQRKIIKIKTDGGVDCVVVPENFLDVAGIATGADALDSISLLFSNGSWNVLENTGYTLSAFTVT